MLEKKVILPEALDIRTLDQTTTRALLQALTSSDDRQVLYALNLLGRTPHGQWHHHLPVLVKHQSSAVRSRTIALLTEGNVYSPSLVEDRLSDSELDVRIEAIRHLCVLAPGESSKQLKKFVLHSHYRVVLAAIHCMAKYQLGNPELIDEQFVERAFGTTGDHAVIARATAASALAVARLPQTPQFLQRLLGDPNPEVVRQAIRTAGAVRYEDAIPLLITMLARASLRREARDALLKLGPPALSELRHWLQDDHTPMEIRARIPKVLSLSPDRSVAGFLLDRVHCSISRLDTPLLKALNRIRAKVPDLDFERERLLALIREECEGHHRMSRIKQVIESDNDGSRGGTENLVSLMTKAIDERLAEIVERVFRLLALIYSPVDIQTVSFNFSSRLALKASAVEFLDNLIDPELSVMVMPLMDYGEAVSPESRNDKQMSPDEAFSVLLASDDDWLKTIAQELADRLNVGGALTPRTA